MKIHKQELLKTQNRCKEMKLDYEDFVAKITLKFLAFVLAGLFVPLYWVYLRTEKDEGLKR